MYPGPPRERVVSINAEGAIENFAVAHTPSEVGGLERARIEGEVQRLAVRVLAVSTAHQRLEVG